MIKVDEVKQFVDSIANKHQSGNSYTVNDFNLWLRRGMDAIFSAEYGLPEDYKPGYPLPRISYELTQRIKDDLRVFKEEPVLIVNAKGEMTLPADYVHYTAIDYYKATNVPGGEPEIEEIGVEVIDDNKWSKRKRNALKKPDKENPICNFGNTFVRFAPTDLHTARLTYLRYPKEPKWAFTLVDFVEIFDPSASIDVELPQYLTNNLSWIILTYIGTKNKDEGLLSYAETVKTRGK